MARSPDDHHAGREVIVAGAGVSGAAAARALRDLGANVTIVDARGGDGIRTDDTTLPARAELVVTSPGWRPDSLLLLAAAGAGVPVWGEVELAWRLRPSGQHWLAVTGTNGKTTAVGMLASISGRQRPATSGIR
jgi:UDP-N-acetylmuramoylalanine--D-glutamate ligase